MQTLVWTKPNGMEIQDLPVPAYRDDEVLLKVDAVGICGSEVEGYIGHNSLRVPPLVMGHEFSGEITELGTSVSGFVKGQRVAVNPLISCGHCTPCRKGLLQLCDKRKIIGIHRPGAFAEYVNVPASAIHVIPDTLGPFRASLTEPLACSLRATRRAMQNHSFANVVVFGAGTIGLLSFVTAQILGASRVIVVDTNEARLKTPERMGATGTISPAQPGYLQKIKTAMGPSGIDVVIDAVGLQTTRSAAVEIINPGGTIMNIGLGTDITRIPINVCVRSEISVLGSYSYGPQDFNDALELIKDGKIEENGWSEIRSLRDGDRAFQELVKGNIQSSKIFLTI
ncbi:galactitol-1-phosphate 5-dehydrogenase [Aneurinibacillus sp. Ricciae_BoGa-3]|uniref:galactitol-1-phosphate 5-dehydrogenase n=1 Tax=Aneurinibacillus sp. Ricciae_BoGa-3 TaxID=3022697 RepID=UPI002340AB6F|nr:galactitol-1-phosphate 5-dehydrogenase [Aneurinibacillus sp. Ricciae_BoGa-3]WCK53229.1 galactitol-1-phosphate 5-dehydrogenase [Aneurinibacillus sp. Ricciae_BoGa-3]